MDTQEPKVSRQNQLQQLLLGLGKHYANTTIVLAGVTYAPGALQTMIQADLAAMTATAQAKAAYSAQVQVERNSHAKVNPVLGLLEHFVISQVGDTQDTSGTLADFGFSPRKSTKKTLATKVEAVEQTKVTRTLRHTGGKRQKEQIKGTTLVTLPPAPLAAATNATPKP